MPHLGQRLRFWAGYSPFQLVSLVRVVGVRAVFCGRGIGGSLPDENTIVIIVGVVRWEDFCVLAFDTWGVGTMGQRRRELRVILAVGEEAEKGADEGADEDVLPVIYRVEL